MGIGSEERGRGGEGTICLQATAVADLENKPQPRLNFLASGSIREKPQASMGVSLVWRRRETGPEEY